MIDQVFRFGDCELRLANRELLRRGVVEEIQSRTFDVLSYLVRHADRLIGKDELLDQVWGHRAVSESALTRTIMKARKAIGDDAHDPRFIVTHHGHGYRFAGEVEPLALVAEVSANDPASALSRMPALEPEHGGSLALVADTAANDPAGALSRMPAPEREDDDSLDAVEAGGPGGRLPRSKSRRSRLSVAVLLMLALALALGFGAWLWLRSRETGPAVTPRLAVLPVVNATGDPSEDWIRLGLMSLMSDSIGEADRVDLVPVAETLGAMKVAGSGKTDGGASMAGLARQVEKILKAKLVVQGRLRSDEGRYDLQIDLFEASGQKITLTFRGSDPVVLATHAGHEIARFLSSSRPSPAISERGKKVSLDPYINETYARALDEAAHGHFQAASHLLGIVVEAMKDQPKAAQLEPMLQLAGVLEKAGSHHKAMQLATRARDIAQHENDPLGLARAYQVMSKATQSLGDLDTAEKYARKELALASPKHPAIAPNAQMRLGDLAFRQSRYDEAERQTRAAMVGYQQMGSNFHLAGGYLELGIIEKHTNVASAVLHDKRALSLARSSGRADVEVNALINLGAAQRTLGDCTQSLRYLDEALALAKNLGSRRQETYAHMGRANCLTAQGHVDDAVKEMQAARKLASALGEPGLEAATLLQYANALSETGNHSRQETEGFYRQAADSFEKTGQLGQASGALLNAAQQMIHDGQYDDAEQTLAKSEALAQQTQDKGLISGTNVARAELDYGRGDKQHALEQLRKARSQSPGLSNTWVNTSASIVWLELDLHHTAKAADVYAQTVGVDKGYVTLCIVSARLLYAQHRFAGALKKQQACLAQLGNRVTDIDRDILDAYRTASRSGKAVALPDKPPPMLWL